jgi:acid phosphatase type 7
VSRFGRWAVGSARTRPRGVFSAAVLVCATAIFVLVTGGVSVAQTTTQTFAAVADAYVQQDRPNSNFGSATTLKLLASSPTMRAYLRFNVQGLTGAVTKATLRLNAASGSSVGYDVRSVASTTWGESTITYANAPPPDANVIRSSGPLKAKQWSAVDVTPLVTGNGQVSIALTTTSTTALSSASREAGASLAPQLLVDTAVGPPTNTGVPAVSGNAQQGQTLSATSGSWSGTTPINYAYQWRRCDQTGAGCADITSATASSYLLDNADVGATIRVRVTASNSAGSNQADSAATAVVTGLPPTNTGAPAVSGNAQQGQTLSATTGSWSGTTPINYAYQWRRCDQTGAGCADITSATASSYLLDNADVGATIRVRVTASNSAGSNQADSPATTAVTGLCSPRSSNYSTAVLGTAGLVGYWRLGESSGTLACDSKGVNNGSYVGGVTLAQPGALANDPDTAVRLNGSDGWVQVPTNASLNVGDHFTIEAWVKRGLAGGTANQVIASKQSGAWVLMFNPSDQLVLRKALVGDVATSATKVTDTTNWHYVAATKDGANVKLYIDGVDVTGTVANQTMTDNTQPLALGQSSSAAYLNGTLDDVALYNAALDASQLGRHYQLGTGSQAPVNTSLPVVSGTAQQGQTLSATTGSWSGTTPISYVYQWRRCDQTGTSCVDIAGATASSYVLDKPDVGGTIRVRVTATNSSGSNQASSQNTSVVSPVASSAGDPVIAAAGDIACDPASAFFNGGLGDSTDCREQYTSDLLVNRGLAAVLALGDDQYDCGGYNAFLQSYDPTWGRVKSITHPVPGNHEYLASGGTGCDPAGNAAGYYQYFGAAAGDPTQGYYSFDVGSWHLIALNSNCAKASGCGVGSAQETWLRADLAAHATTCTLVYWHHPRFTSGSVGNDSEVAPFWNDLYAAGADVVLNGHAHSYERFAPQDPSESYDPVRGIREFVVGTGGDGFLPLGSAAPLTEARAGNAFGVLLLTLHADSYDWQFLPEAGGTYSDSGSTYCH